MEKEREVFVELTLCIEGRSESDGTFYRSGRRGEEGVGVRGGRCRQGGVRALGADRAR